MIYSLVSRERVVLTEIYVDSTREIPHESNTSALKKNILNNVSKNNDLCSFQEQ